MPKDATIKSANVICLELKRDGFIVVLSLSFMGAKRNIRLKNANIQSHITISGVRKMLKIHCFLLNLLLEK